MKKVFRWIGIVLLSPILLFAILTILIYIPPVQNWMVQRATSIASEQTGLDVSVGHISLAFPLDLCIEEVRITQQNDSLPHIHDTIADIRRLIVDVQLCPLFNGKVVVEELQLDDSKINTANFIASARINGSLERLSMKSRSIDLEKQTVELDEALLKGAHFNVELSDTVPPDTTTSETLWKIYINKVEIARTDVSVHMPGDTLQITAGIGKAKIKDGEIDLGRSLYRLASFDWNDGSLAYDNNFEPKVSGLDFNHLALTGINIGIDSVYYCSPDARLRIRNFSMKEKSGIEVKQMEGNIAMDAARIQLPALTLRTSDSDLEAHVNMDLNALDSINPGKVDVRLLASLGKQDVMRFCGDVPKQFILNYPNHPITVRTSLNGNMQHLDITGLMINLPTAFNCSAEGYADNPTDIKSMKADVRLNVKTFNIGFLTALAGPDAMKGFRIPSGITLDGRLRADREHYSADLTAREGHGKVTMKGSLNAPAMAYEAQMGIQELNLHHFMPHDSLYNVTANARLKGRGTDFLSQQTKLEAEASLDKFEFGSLTIDGIGAALLVKDGNGHAEIKGHNELFDGTITADALLDTKRIEATLGTDLRRADLFRLRLVDKQMTVGACAHIDISSDLDQYHALKGFCNDFTVITAKKTFRPTDLEIDLFTNRDTTWANIKSGSLDLDMKASGGYQKLIDQFMSLKDECMQQVRNKVIDQPKLRDMFPIIDIRFTSGTDNPMANFLRFRGFAFQELFLNMKMSPQTGLNGDMHLYSTVADSTRIDTVRMNIYQDDTNIRFNGLVQNNKRNPQFVFKTVIDGCVLERGAELNVKYYDASDQLGVLLGTRAERCDSGIIVRFLPDRPVLGYKAFNLNKDNYIFLGRNRRISAGIDLVADDGTGVKVYSDDSNYDMLQDLTVSLNKFDLEKITSVMPYAPRITGLLNGDFHVMQDKEQQLSMVSDMWVSKMTYEKCPMGDIGTEFAYLQKEDSTHFVEATLHRDGRRVGVLTGNYRNEGEGYLDAKLNLTRFPLSTVNGFFPDRIIGLLGYAEGVVDVKGQLSSPVVNGEVYLDSSYIVSVPYGVTLRFDNDPVRVVGSNLLLENFTMYAHNDNPLNIAGFIDFSNLDRIKMDVKMRARNYQLIDSKQTKYSIAYGKAFVNFFGSLAGDLDNLKMRGQLDVLGKTDMTYILKDSPLNTDDHMKELVTFTDFRDTTHVEVSRPPIGGLDMLLMMNIEQGAHIFCALNGDRSNYVDIEGGGELRMTYSPANDMQLFGRYTINDGTMKYSLPIIPLKTFNIGEGSYIEFTGDMMNPKLNLTATEEVKTLVTQEGGTSRSVTFNCGVKVTKTLNDMGLEFTIDAPEDMAMTNELTTMSAEDRGKAAVMMLTTGMYMADGNSGNFSMNSALSSFMQNQINNITGNAMRTVDLSVGIDQNADAAGNTYNDYSFKFAKRFWNNRVNFVIGGKLSDNSSETTTTEQDQTFIDNVSLEYRIDQTSMRYVRLFYNKEANDLLEGRISEYGAGFMWRKKADRFWQLFNFRTSDTNSAMRRMMNNPLSAPAGNGSRQNPPQQKADTTAVQPIKQDSTTTDEEKK